MQASRVDLLFLILIMTALTASIRRTPLLQKPSLIMRPKVDHHASQPCCLQVPCKVMFSLTPVLGASPGASFPMLLDPPEMTIPPASSGMLAIPFMPSAMGRFAALLEAAVQLPPRPAAQGAAKPEAGGAAAAAKLQVCKLMGEAGLPSLSLELPKGFEEPGQALGVRFSKLLKVCRKLSVAQHVCRASKQSILACLTKCFQGTMPLQATGHFWQSGQQSLISAALLLFS